MVESYINGTFHKFNANQEYENNLRMYPYDSLTHFSHHYTDGELLLCDLQGSLKVLTDPQLNTTR